MKDTRKNAKPQGLKQQLDLPKSNPDLSNVDRFEKKVLVLAEISKPKKIYLIFFTLKKKT
ncbi:MAG: hypothetical protein Ct9H90mP2_03810 [Dehalococcoidia bacterium]|nr:MAG: hypothetical protein Ct9H90mP2_03810 [Dehalococcoidia bacterium]